MTDQFRVRHTELVAHAATIESIGDRVRTAQQAGDSVRAGADAYGTLCVTVPLMLGALQTVLVDAVAHAAGALHDTGARLRATADDYDTADQRSAKAMQQIRGAR